MSHSDTEIQIFDILNSHTSDYRELMRSVEMLEQSYPDFPVLKFFFYKISHLNLSETEAKNLFNHIVKHCSVISSKIGRSVNFFTGMADYVIERNRIIFNPVFVSVSLFEKMEEKAFRDPVTSSYTKHYMEKALASEIGRFQRNQIPFSVLLIDVFNFAMINNYYGFHAGNRILTEIVERIQRDIRAEDTLIREGDERFLLILPGTKGKGATETAERILSNMVKDVVHIDDHFIHIILNIAVIEFPRHAESQAELIALFEPLRYKIRELGQNRILNADILFEK